MKKGRKKKHKGRKRRIIYVTLLCTLQKMLARVTKKESLKYDRRYWQPIHTFGELHLLCSRNDAYWERKASRAKVG